MRFLGRCYCSVSAQLGESDHSTDATVWWALLLGGCDRSMDAKARQVLLSGCEVGQIYTFD
ncbi:MAG TPA: hypothetical protein VGN87_15510 [Paenibacillus sp.]